MNRDSCAGAAIATQEKPISSRTTKTLMQYSHPGFVSHANEVRTPLLGGADHLRTNDLRSLATRGSAAIALPKQLRQPGEVHRHPPRLVSGEHLGLAGGLRGEAVSGRSSSE
jgi:hypothetical protein